MIAGNPGHRPLNTDEPEPDGDLCDPPPAFSRGKLAARLQAEWREIIADAPEGLLKRLDKHCLQRYVVALVTFNDADERVQEAGLVVTIRGQTMQNPFLKVRNDANAIMNQLSDQLGFSPAARTRVKISGKKKAKSALGKLRELKI
jgi:P27 family predicted phage terminase small subunit